VLVEVDGFWGEARKMIPNDVNVPYYQRAAKIYRKFLFQGVLQTIQFTASGMQQPCFIELKLKI
jgi:hypothetical protein